MDVEHTAAGLSSALQFKPYPIWDPVPWPYLIDILDRRQILEISRIQVGLQREMLTAQAKAAAEVEKLLGAGL